MHIVFCAEIILFLLFLHNITAVIANKLPPARRAAAPYRTGPCAPSPKPLFSYAAAAWPVQLHAMALMNHMGSVQPTGSPCQFRISHFTAVQNGDDP